MTKTDDKERVRESVLEDALVASLAVSPLYRQRPATAFDAITGLDAAETAAFIQATQPKEWMKITKQFQKLYTLDN